MSSIELHPEKGVNPKMTYCTRCGGETSELILVGRRDYVETCRDCGMACFGGRQPKKEHDKSGCRSSGGWEKRPIGENERLPSTGVCSSCETELNEHVEIVAAGGIYFKCEACPATGVIRPSSGLAKKVREAHEMSDAVDGVFPSCGVAFDSKNCPVCGPKANNAE